MLQYFHKPEIHCSIEAYGVNCSFLFHFFVVCMSEDGEEGGSGGGGCGGGEMGRKGMTVPQNILRWVRALPLPFPSFSFCY